MKILINTPDTSILGGVANHYKGLLPFWSQEVEYNFIGRRKSIPSPVILIYDYLKYLFLCIYGKYDIIILNPSLGKTAIKRDTLFLRIAKWFNIKTIIFFHGWSNDIVADLNNNSSKFKETFNKADKIIVLAQAFKNDLIKWGITKPIFLTSTKVNDELLIDFNFNDKEWNQNILFLTRIETYKGIFTTLEAFETIKIQIPNATLTIAGDGSQLSKAKEFVKQHKLKDVHFLGNVTGDKLIDTFANSSLYILPSHGEGMPTSVLEAMAFGLPIVSRPVGGLVDFFEQNKMGYLIKSLKPEEFAEKIIQLLSNTEQLKEIGKYNYEYAKKNFLASKVALEIENIVANV